MVKRIFFIQLLLNLCLMVLFFAADPALALNSDQIDRSRRGQEIIIPTTPIPGQKPVTTIELVKLITVLGNFLIILAPVILVIALIVGAVLYMTAGDSGRVDKAKAWLKGAIIGGFIVFGVGVIINTMAIIVSRQFFCQAGIDLNVFGVDLSRCFVY